MNADPITTSPVRIPPGSALRIGSGEVMIFVARLADDGLGRWVPLGSCIGPDVVLGAQVPDAVLLGSSLPGAVVQIISDDDVTPDEREASGRWLHHIELRLGLIAGGSAPRPTASRLDHRMTVVAVTALESDVRAMEEKAASDALQERHDAWLIRDALTDLTEAVPGHSEIAATDEAGNDINVVLHLASLVGLSADPVRLRHAVADAAVSGRDRLTALAAACDATVRRVQLPADWWRTQGPPLLVTVEETGQHAVAQWGRGGYRIWHSATGSGARVDADAPLSGTGLLLEPLLDPSRPARLRDLMRLSTRGTGPSVAMLLSMSVLIGILSAVIPVVSGRLTTSIASGGGTPLASVAAALVLVVIAVTALQAVRTFAIMRVRTRATAVAAGAVWDRQLRLPMRWHNARTQPSRITDANSVDSASASASDEVVTALLDTASLLGAVFGAFLVSPWIAAAIAGFLVVRGLIDSILMRRQARLAREIVDDAALSPMLQLLQGVNRLRSSGATGRAYARWAHGASDAVRLSVRSGRLSMIRQMLGALWPALGLALTLTVIALTMGDASDAEALGAFVTAETALTAANGAMGAAIASVGAGLSAVAILRRAEPILQALPESAGSGQIAPLTGGIDMRDLVYRYAPDLPPIFSGVSLQVLPGEHLALVGPSGSGKTTLLRLLLGLDDPESGLVSFDGRDLSGLDRSAVRRQIGAVMQSSSLMPGSIRENVDLGRGLTAPEVWDALDRAAVGDDVREMPMGLATVVVEGGAGISGGQRQRILLARALAGSPRILVLDEATSALDNVSQAAVVANLDRLKVTRIVVAHRLSTIMRADRIAVLADGRIVQQGTFDELVAEDGPFRVLVERQSVDLPGLRQAT